MATGRFAPSPTGALHLGNLRTALVAWLFARAAGSAFIVRMEDLDLVTSSAGNEEAQLRDLAAIGLDWDGPVVRQSERFDLYRAAIAELTARGLTYECYCSRREIRDAAAAPHGSAPDGAYPGTCRTLTRAQIAEREAEGRRPALRLRGEDAHLKFEDRLHGSVTGRVDDVVLSRNDGVPAYNLAVVVDDAAQGVEQVVRGDDLLTSTPRQIRLAQLLGLPVPQYAHVPLVLGPDGTRLAKRHGAVTLEDLAAKGIDADDVRSLLAESLGLASRERHTTITDLLARFDPDALPRTPWVLDPSVALGEPR
jgi:glutamyl-tRNA synthetase